MGGNLDHSDFVDPDFEAARRAGYGPGSPAVGALAPLAPAGALGGAGPRGRTREELDQQVTVAQQRLIELRRAQEELERERATLEEDRRRRIQYEQGREEMLQHLTRGIEMLKEAELAVRRDAEQMARTLLGLHEALGKVQALNEQAWSPESYAAELTRALATVDNARMEWNSAQVRWPILTSQAASPAGAVPVKDDASTWLRPRSFGDLCRLGFALTWPVSLAIVATGVVILVMLTRR